MTDSTQKLVQLAIDAAHTAYAPYSNFHVGAALLLDTGEIITGSNFENASYGMTLCAETVAIAKANSDGKLRAIREIAVAGGLAG
ncbi:MAG: cytidine deaminase, partial [Sphingorhabdus sp.]